MYNKLFTKILDSTIWLEPDATRLVWITFIAAMDEDGFVALSSVGNVAARARVSLEAAEAAVRSLEAPDAIDSAQENEGRRIERVPSGWMVINSSKYRDIIRRATAREHTRQRVAKFRERNATVTQGNEKVTSSVAVAVSKAEEKKKSARRLATPLPLDFKISERVKAWAEEKGFTDLEPDLEFFTGRMKANGKTYADWDEAFMNCVREDWPGLRKEKR